MQGASAEQVERVFAPKVGGAHHLSELTEGYELTHFICFSSTAGLFGAPGQGAYAAANRYLDALAQARRAEGLPATSIAWGLWQRETAMVAGLGGKDVARIGRGGISALSDEQGLSLFDRALATTEPLSRGGGPRSHGTEGELGAPAPAPGRDRTAPKDIQGSLLGCPCRPSRARARAKA